jgi:NAD dependent epimerase/dehydratase family enzyme
LGGKIGSGKQWVSWITLDDVVGALRYALASETLHGPVNFVAPSPVRNAEFTKTLGQELSRPTFFPIPEFGARLVFGEMADALLLSSQRVDASRLKEAGYHFVHSRLRPALSHVLKGG